MNSKGESFRKIINSHKKNFELGKCDYLQKR